MMKKREFSFRPYSPEKKQGAWGLSVDVDDIVEAFQEFLGKPRREKDYHSRLETELLHTLNFLDHLGGRYTFFISGTDLKYAQPLLPEILKRGHEIGSHGKLHRPVYEFSAAGFEKDLGEALEDIEQSAGVRPVGYRAPGLTLMPAAAMAVPVLEKFGFLYSSSLPPVSAPQHKFITAPAEPFYWTEKLVELPVSSVRWLGLRWPVCGSIYTRLYPAFLNTLLFNRAKKKGKALFLYFHPFELFIREAKKTLKNQDLFGLHQRLYLMSLGSFEQKMCRILKEQTCLPYNQFLP